MDSFNLGNTSLSSLEKYTSISWWENLSLAFTDGAQEISPPITMLLALLKDKNKWAIEV